MPSTALLSPLTLLVAGVLYCQAPAAPAAPATPAKPPLDDARLVAEACNSFAVDLHGKLAANGAPSASPASIALALLLLEPGAGGATADELHALLHLPAELRGERLHAAVGKLRHGLQHLTAGAPERGETGKAPPQLRIVDDLWLQTGRTLEPGYTDTVNRHFAAELRWLDFRADSEAARATINAAIAKATNDRIRDLLTPDDVTAETRLVLTNALWLRASWVHEFSPGATKPEAFRLADGTSIEVPTMRRTAALAYAGTEAWHVVALPFEGCSLRCEVMVPRGDHQLAAAERALLAGEHLSLLTTKQVAIKLPKVVAKSRLKLRAPLIELGLTSLFDIGRIDLKGMNAANDFVAHDVIHETWLQLDENGAEAAAATAVVMRAGSAAPQQTIDFRADRPFAVVLRDTRTGLILFMTRVDDPRESKTS